MKRKAMMAVLLGTALLAAGCGKKAPETEAVTEASTAAVETESDTKTESAEETEGTTEAPEGATEAAEETTEAPEEATEAAEGTTEAPEGTTEAAEEATEAASDELVELGERPAYTATDYVTVGEYKGLNIVVEPKDVSDADVESSVNAEIQAKELYETEGTVEDGDLVNIDYEGKKDGVAFAGGTAQGADLKIGSDSFIDGFEDGLIGVKVGETVDLNLTFPEDYPSEDLAGQAVVFTVTVNYIVPELTDDLAAVLSEEAYVTADSYRESVRETLASEDQRFQVYNEIMTQVYNTCTVNDYPQELVDFAMASIKNSYIQAAQESGMSLSDLVAAYGMTEEQFDEVLLQNIKGSLQQELILKAIAETEGITVSDEEYEAGCEEYAASYGYPTVEQFKEDFDRPTVEISLMMEKTMEMISDNAVIEEAEETEAPAEETEAQTEAADSVDDMIAQADLLAAQWQTQKLCPKMRQRQGRKALKRKRQTRIPQRELRRP